MNAENSLYMIGLFSYAMLMAGSIIWTGIGIARAVNQKQPYDFIFAIGMLACAIMFACLTLVVAEPQWLQPGALIPATRLAAAIAVLTLGATTAIHITREVLG